MRDGEVERVPGIGHIYGMTFSLISYNEGKDRFARLNFPFIGQSRDFFIVSSNGDYFDFAVGPGFYEFVIEGALRAFPKTRQFRVPENFVLTTFERS